MQSLSRVSWFVCCIVLLYSDVQLFQQPPSFYELYLFSLNLISLFLMKDSLPMTRSGKIMRRILRKIAAGEADQLGDVSTLADPSVVDDLIAKTKV